MPVIDALRLGPSQYQGQQAWRSDFIVAQQLEGVFVFSTACGPTGIFSYHPNLPACLPACPPVCRSARLPACLPVCRSVCLPFAHLVPYDTRSVPGNCQLRGSGGMGNGTYHSALACHRGRTRQAARGEEAEFHHPLFWPRLSKFTGTA
jgi:hypothetical protein